jgi:hypothetical protein
MSITKVEFRINQYPIFINKILRDEFISYAKMLLIMGYP